MKFWLDVINLQKVESAITTMNNNWTAKNKTYQNFKKGNIKCPYEPKVYGVGYLGEGKYKTWGNGRKADEYIMRRRARNILFDFRDTEFMDSSGIGAIMGRYRLADSVGGRVGIVNTNSNIMQI